jgi:hypothetical protein
MPVKINARLVLYVNAREWITFILTSIAPRGMVGRESPSASERSTEGQQKDPDQYNEHDPTSWGRVEFRTIEPRKESGERRQREDENPISGKPGPLHLFESVLPL